MSENDHDIKHVIILDENSKNISDEAEDLLQELDDLEAKEDERRADKVDPEEKDVPYERRKEKKGSGKLKRHIVVLAISLVLLGILVFIGINRADAGYREPVKIYEEFLNKEVYNGEDLSYAYANGLAVKQFRELRRVLHGSDEYLRALDETEKTIRLSYDKDTVSTVTIDEVKPLSKDTLLAYEADFKGIVGDISISSYALGGDRELAAAVNDLTDKLIDAHITDGYHLYCTIRRNSKGADGPVSSMEKAEFTVVRLDGHWIMWDKIYDVFRMTF